MTNVAEVRDAGLCMGCGVCEAACPCSVVHMREDTKRGLLFPSIEEDSCTGCGMCMQACPGIEVDFADLTRTFLGAETSANIIGVYNSCYYAHACDTEVRYNGASGGLVTALLIHALEKGEIDGAVVTRMSPQEPLKAETFVARNREEIVAASGSKYCPTSVGAALRKVAGTDGRFAVVGLPCQIHGIRKLEKLDAGLRSKLAFHFGLFCSNNSTFLGTRYFLSKHGIAPETVTGIRYRAGGWPGRVAVRLRDGTSREFPRGTTETSWRRKLLFSSSFHYDFMVPRCLLCSDLTSELADISFGDPWTRLMLETETVGKSMLIVRTRAASDLLLRAEAESVVELTKIKAETVERAQRIGFKLGVGCRVWLRKAIGGRAPSFPGKELRCHPWAATAWVHYWMSYLTPLRDIWPALAAVSIIRRGSIRLEALAFRFASFLIRWIMPGRRNPASAVNAKARKKGLR